MSSNPWAWSTSVVLMFVEFNVYSDQDGEDAKAMVNVGAIAGIESGDGCTYVRTTDGHEYVCAHLYDDVIKKIEQTANKK